MCAPFPHDLLALWEMPRSIISGVSRQPGPVPGRRWAGAGAADVGLCVQSQIAASSSLLQTLMGQGLTPCKGALVPLAGFPRRGLRAALALEDDLSKATLQRCRMPEQNANQAVLPPTLRQSRGREKSHENSWEYEKPQS